MKKFLASILIYSLFISNSFAESTVFSVNPKSIREQLFSKNISLREALNNVQNSKLNVSMARAKLLPSLNLTLLLPALANPTFLLGQITFLFPFLVPSNWAVLKQQKNLFESDKASYKALQLNILSNALSLYYTYLNDLEVKKVFTDQSEILGRFYLSLKRQSDILGNVSLEDLSMAQASWEESKIRVSKLQELLIEEKSGLRTLLGLPLGAELNVETADLPSSDFETKSAGEIADHSLDVAPEAFQLDFLIKAAQSGKFAKMFGFISSASIGGSSVNSSSPFDSLKAQGGFSFGADNLVNIKIANNNIESILLREEQFKQENERIAEVIIGKLKEAKDQQGLSLSALQSRLKVFEGQKRQFELGLISLQALLQTEAQLTDSKVNNLKTNLDLKMQRLTLLRLVIDGDFALVKGCVEAPQVKRGILYKLFHFKEKKSLDQMCQQ